MIVCRPAPVRVVLYTKSCSQKHLKILQIRFSPDLRRETLAHFEQVPEPSINVWNDSNTLESLELFHNFSKKKKKSRGRRFESKDWEAREAWRVSDGTVDQLKLKFVLIRRLKYFAMSTWWGVKTRGWTTCNRRKHSISQSFVNILAGNLFFRILEDFGVFVSVISICHKRLLVHH